MENLKKNRKIYISVAVVVLATLIMIIVHKIYDRNRTFDSYKVEYTMEISDGVDNEFYPYKTGVLKYSSDGMAYIDGGKEIWNQGFEIKNPVMDICGDYVAIAEEDSNDINIYNASGEAYKVSASYPVKNLEVSRQGVVAAVLADEAANYIEVIAKDGTQIAIGRTVLQGDGYPVDISISEDATKVAAAYLAVTSGEIQSKIVFYNYSEVGKNETDRIVGGFNDFEDSLIPDIEFINENTVAAIGDNIIAIYSIDETPSEVARIKVKNEIQSVVYDDKYIALIVKNDESGKNMLQVYDLTGKRVLSQEEEFAYSGIKMSDGNIIMYNDTECKVVSVAGVTKFKYNFTMGITSIVPVSGEEFIFISGKNVQKILLN
ncbi:DUF5711 family protein [Lachnospiraceae bacterium HCP1S3_A2]